MLRNSSLCLVTTSLILAGTSHAQTIRPEDVGLSSEKLALIHQAVQVNIATGQIPGAIVLVARDGKVVYTDVQGAADPAGTQPLKVDSIFPLASLTKNIIATAVLMLVDEGKMGLNDPIGKYIPELGGARQVRVLRAGSPPYPYSPLPGPLPPSAEYGPAQFDLAPALREITVRDLLTHTSGIQEFGVGNDFPAATPGDTLATRLPKLAAAPLEFQPGSRWAYSNAWGFELLGRMVEVASGLPLDQFIKQRLLDPLGMSDTGFGVRRDAAARAVAQFGPRVQFADEVTYFSGGAGLQSTVADYAKFVQMLVDGGRANNTQFLKPETFKAMTSNQIGWLRMSGYPPMAMPAEGLRFGYGVVLVSLPTAASTRLPAGSFGWDGVGTRRWWALPEQRIVIVMMAPGIGPMAAPFHRMVEAAVMSSIVPQQ
jgi:CubicO group peptidase (beta-lactamase class C family)